MADEIVAEVEYREIPGFPAYRAGNDGTIQSCISDSWKTLKPGIVGKGYLGVGLSNGTRHQKYVHRLVLEAFVGPCPEGMEACHNNGNRKDNRLINLRWDTGKANNHDKIAHGTDNKGERHGHAKLTSQQVVEMRRMYRAGVSTRELCEFFGTHSRTIRKGLTGASWCHVTDEQPIRPNEIRMPYKLTAETSAEIKELVLGGAKRADIASRFGVSTTRVHQLAKETQK